MPLTTIVGFPREVNKRVPLQFDEAGLGGTARTEIPLCTVSYD